jgi:hypothetical protein
VSYNPSGDPNAGRAGRQAAARAVTRRNRTQLPGLRCRNNPLHPEPPGSRYRDNLRHPKSPGPRYRDNLRHPKSPGPRRRDYTLCAEHR